MLLDIASVFICLFYLVTTIEFYFGYKKIKKLSDVKALESNIPKVSIIIPARNEEHTIKDALQSVTQLSYPDYEIIVINDRSTDNTQSVLDDLKLKHPEIKTIKLSSLPSGWIGKNFAMHKGSLLASGKYFLFTDADVHFNKDTLSKAISYAESNNVQHLSMMPEIESPGLLLQIFVAVFGIFFSMWMKPWKAQDPKSRNYIGIGAFNLIEREAYFKSGGFEKIKMRPDEDIKLGKIVKLSGGRSVFMYGADLITVKWYNSFKEVVCGMYKNSFAGLNYNLFLAIGAVISVSTVNSFPYISLIFTEGYIVLANLLSVICIFCLYLLTGNKLRSFYMTILHPIGSILFAFVIGRSTLLTYLKNGISWRETHYSLKELKKNRV